jgi:hypothetical protein
VEVLSWTPSWQNCYYRKVVAMERLLSFNSPKLVRTVVPNPLTTIYTELING